MMITKERMAFAIASACFCLLLIALWARSYKTCDLLSRTAGNGWITAIGSDAGSPYFIHMYLANANAGYELPRDTNWQYLRAKARGGWPKYGWAWNAQKMKIQVPYYLLVGFTAPPTLVSGLPWFRQFNLRSLLVVMTLLAAYVAALRFIVK
jgi:hypothetical protein